MKTSRAVSWCAACLICCASFIVDTSSTHAQVYPVKPIRIVVPFSPGGGTDVIARLVAQKLNAAFGRPIIIDNRDGAAGNTAAGIVARALPDGYTVLMATAAHAMSATLYTKLNYGLVKDFSPVSLTGSSPYVLAINSSVQAKSVKDLIALAKSRPGELAYGSAGSGSPPHLAAEMFKSMTGIELLHVPYKGTGPVLTGLATGEVQLSFSTVPAALPLVKTGKVRALGVSSLRRTPLAPDLPTVAESVPGFEVMQWYGFLVPVGTTNEIVSRLNTEIVKALKSTDLQERFAGLGADPLSSTPQEFGALIQSEIRKWGKTIRDSGMHID